MKSTYVRRTLTLTTLALALFVGSALAQQSPSSGTTTAPNTMMANQKAVSDMMARGQKMMADMQADDQKLDELVTAMNATRGNDRLDAMATLIKELVAHQKTTRAMMTSMMSMHSMMMGNMMSNGRTQTAPPKDK